jgi:hypothetical protein
MEFNHINPKTRVLLDYPIVDRINAIRRDRFIPYRRGKLMIAEMDKIMLTPSAVRAQCILLVGDSGMGKTALLDFAQRHYAKLLGEDVRRQLVCVTLPHITTDRRLFYGRILKSLGIPHRTADKPDFLHEQVVDALRDAGTRALIIDEFHNFLGGGVRGHLSEHMSAIRDIANIPISIVGAGTRSVESCVLADDQLEQRFSRYWLQVWEESDELRDFLATWESRIPLKLPSDLAGPTLLPLLMRLSRGHTRRMINLIKLAAELAVTTQVERITEDLLRRAFQELSAVSKGYSGLAVPNPPKKGVKHG